jgi:quercetin dioxygenase-like cupin family protein
MRTRRLLPVFGVAIGAAALAAGSALPTTATDHSPPPIAVEALSPRVVFTDDVAMQLRVKLDGRGTNVLNVHDPSRVMTARLIVQPGAQFPWHTHPGPVLVTVVEGSLTYMNANDCVARPYPAGTAFIDPGQGNVHTAYNATGQEVVLVATFFGATPDGPLTVPVDGPADNCGLTLAEHDH